MNTAFLEGELVCLVAYDPDRDAELFARWSRDSEYARLLDSEPARVWTAKRSKEEMIKFLEEQPGELVFVIRTRAGDQPVGFISLEQVFWPHADAGIGIGLGERAYWGKGYGTDAMRVLVRYAFTELGLHRLSLNVFEYKARAIRSYEKAGFVVEGRQRGFLHREGRRWDFIYMGLLREEWEKSKA